MRAHGEREPAGAGPTRRLLLGAAVAALALPRAASAAQPTDIEQLERLLVLEQRLEAGYATALERDAIERGLGELLLAHEREHVRGLTQSLRARGGRAPRATAPPPQLGAALASRRAFAELALRLEGETVAAYQEVLASSITDRLLLPLGSIMACGAQHEVALRQVLDGDLLGS